MRYGRVWVGWVPWPCCRESTVADRTDTWRHMGLIFAVCLSWRFCHFAPRGYRGRLPSATTWMIDDYMVNEGKNKSWIMFTAHKWGPGIADGWGSRISLHRISVQRCSAQRWWYDISDLGGREPMTMLIDFAERNWSNNSAQLTDLWGLLWRSAIVALGYQS